MATTATNTYAASARAESHRFYMWMAGVFLLIAFGGFTPTYWSKVGAGTFHAEPIIHIHGMLLFAWVCFYFFQTALVATGRTLNHRTWGLAGISLFTAMMFSILVAEVSVLARNEALGFGEGARRFAAVTLLAWPLMATIFTLAIINIKKPETHKRLMLLLMVGIMTPAIARVFITLFAPPGAVGPPPPFVSVPPGLIADLLLVAAMVRDWRTRGRPHAVYVYGGIALLAQQLLTVPMSNSAAWMHFARAFQSLGG